MAANYNFILAIEACVFAMYSHSIGRQSSNWSIHFQSETELEIAI